MRISIKGINIKYNIKVKFQILTIVYYQPQLQFIVTYIAPWQITWGSAFHAFAQVKYYYTEGEI